MQLIQRKTGITKTSVRRWKEKPIKKRYFETIAECLKIDVAVENYNKELLRKRKD